MAIASLITRDVEKLADQTGNVYESLVIIARRSRQISTKVKEELNNKLADFASTVDNLEEIFENREQIEISKFYERMPKPTVLATEEFIEGKIMFRKPQPEAEIAEEPKEKESKK
jgi:DNA-directed RNA polymerase subunit K/omega